MAMTSMERLLKVLNHEEPDRVPLFILISFYGAKLLKMPIEAYFSNPEHILKAQKLARDQFDLDCFYAFHYAAIEHEAFGGEVIFQKDGPPIAGKPIIKAEDIDRLEVPKLSASPGLQRVIESIKLLKEEAMDDIPIAGVVMSPFSLPIMQMGFSAYLDLLIQDREKFEKLMAVNEKFCLEWANAQLKAGATFITYFDPMLSTRILPKEITLETGFEVAKRVLPKFIGPSVIHFASGESLALTEQVLDTQAVGTAVSYNEKIDDFKDLYKDKKLLVGNINGVEMVNWSLDDLEDNVKKIIQGGAPGGGFILSDSHGEIPWQVPVESLVELSNLVKKWGVYPIE